MRIVRGDFQCEDQTSIYIPDNRPILNGWGKLGSTHVVGEPLKPIPTRLFIAWYSYAEDEFYSAKIALSVETIANLFAQGFTWPGTTKRTTYSRILVGLALEGGISLWLVGKGVVLEIQHFVAEREKVGWLSVYGNRNIPKADFINDVMDRRTKDKKSIIHSSGDRIPRGLWKNYRRRFAWKPEVYGVQPIQMWLRTYNGERKFIDFKNELESESERARPKAITVDWENNTARQYSTEILFDEREVFRVFDKLSTEAPDQPFLLQIEVSDKSFTVDVSLKTSNHIVRFEKMTQRTFLR
jgi:hypothetical protein